MRFSTSRINDIILVKAEMDRLDFETASTLKGYLVDTLEENPDAALVLDFSDLRYIDSSGLGALIATYRETGSRRKAAILGASGQVGEALRIARFARFMPLLSNVLDRDQLSSAIWLKTG